MIHYYLNPKTRDLILFDAEQEEIFIVPRIEKIRVFTGNDIQLGDFDGGVGKEAAPSAARTQETTKKVRKCKACGEAGHRSDNCPQNKT